MLDAQAPPWGPNNLINRLNYYALQLGDPHPIPRPHSIPRPAVSLGLTLPGVDIRTEKKLVLVKFGPGFEPGTFDVIATNVTVFD